MLKLNFEILRFLVLRFDILKMQRKIQICLGGL